MPAETAIRSELLCDLDKLPAEHKAAVGSALVRALRLVPQPEPELDDDFDASVSSGLYETYEQFDARMTREGH